MADQGGEGLLSPYLRRRRLEAVRPFLRGRVLDFGCGSGALAQLVPADRYLGVEVDAVSLRLARSKFPGHRFVDALPVPAEGMFDTVVLLAVIEHVAEPVACLRALAARLAPADEARLVLTTPHPWSDRIHDAGSALGLFSRHANEEHEQLLDRRRLADVGRAAGLRLVAYRRFLGMLNQLAIYALE